MRVLPTTKQYADLSVSLKGLDEKTRTITGIVASDGLEDRHGEKLSPQGWVINDHVPLYWGHDYSQLPVGKTTREVVQNGQLIVDGFLSKKYQFAKDLFDLITEGIVDKVSVGFIPKEWDESGEYTYSKMELLEVSFVGIPANPRAGIKAKIKSVEDGLNQLIEAAQKDAEETQEEAPAEPETAENGVAEEVTPEVEPEVVPEKALTAVEIKEMIANAVAEALKSAETKTDDEVTEPATKTVAEQLTELRDALRGQYAGTAKTLEQINKYLKKGDK